MWMNSSIIRRQLATISPSFQDKLPKFEADGKLLRILHGPKDFVDWLIVRHHHLSVRLQGSL